MKTVLMLLLMTFLIGSCLTSEPTQLPHSKSSVLDTLALVQKENNPEQYLFMPWCLIEFQSWLLERNHHEEALAIEEFSQELHAMKE